MNKILIILFLFLSCKSQKVEIYNSNDHMIITDLINREKAKSYFIIKKSLNSELLRNLKKNVYFDSGLYHEFGTLRNRFSNEIKNEVFNEKEISYLLSQIDEKFEWEQTYLRKIKLKIGTSKENYIQFSKPIYTNDGKYSMIMYEKGNHFHQIGNGGILLYSKNKEKWEVISSFFDTIQ